MCPDASDVIKRSIIALLQGILAWSLPSAKESVGQFFLHPVSGRLAIGEKYFR